MLSELGKNIVYALITEGETVPGQRLGILCGTSVNTIRKEIPVLNETLQEHGCCIDTKQSAGFMLRIENRKKAEPYLQETLRRIRRFSYINLEEYAKAYFIMRYLLVTPGTHTADSVAARMFCSKSTVLREFPRIRNYLSGFSLVLDNSKTKGLAIAGSEWDKRICLLFLEKAYNSLSAAEQNSEEFFQHALFKTETDSAYKMIRSILTKKLKESRKISIPSLYMPKISHYILFAHTRCAYRDQIHFTDNQSDKAKDTIVYPFVKDLYTALPKIYTDGISETDISGLSMLIQTYRSLSKPDDISKQAYEQYSVEAEEICIFILQRHHLNDFIDKKLLQDLTLYLYSLNCSLLYRIPFDPELCAPSSMTGILTSSLCIEFARYFRIRHQVQLTETQAFGTYYIFNRRITELNLFPYKQKILLSSIYGLAYADNLANRLRKYYGRYIDRIDTCANLLTDTYDQNAYDCVLTDTAANDLDFLHIPALPMDFIRSAQNRRLIENRLCAVMLEHACEIFTPDRFRHIYARSREEIYTQICADLHLNADESTDMIRDLTETDLAADAERHNRIVLISPFSKTFPAPDFRLYIIPDGFVWNRNLSNIFIYYQYGAGTQEEIECVNFLIRSILNSPSEISVSLPDMTYEDVLALMNDFRNLA